MMSRVDDVDVDKKNWLKEGECMRIYSIAYMRLSRRTYFLRVIPMGKLELGGGSGACPVHSECSAWRMTVY